ncbi:P-loop containing nucleoside triphosphate hydrolase protein [Lichtheimia hyalospora FSU 10163]|nr:P-loop containing nucleoside triphosphate hydrolase protein [Lichtheimia hyalospora FSU 10163]
MPAITPAQLSALQKNVKNIRNICILAHVDHGKTTLSDSLLATNGIISSKMAGKVRYLDSREDEQERGITMESSAISLYFKLVRAVQQPDGNDKAIASEYLINLIDSPGHVDFSSEVSTASRLCDGGLVLVDVVEGVCTQTISVLRQAWIDKVRPILVFNKMDRLIVELKLTPLEAYNHLNRILEQVNAIMATFYTGDVMEDEARKLETENNQEQDGVDWERDDSDIYFDPTRGNVIFASAVDGWAFRIQQFASIYFKKLGFKESVLQKCLWGDYYFDAKAKRVIQHKHLKGRSLKPMFVQFVLDNIWAVYDSVTTQNRERTEKIVASLNIKVLPRDLRSRDTQTLLAAIFTQWLPLSTCVLLAIIGQLPPPVDAQRVRIPKMLYPDLQFNDNEPPNPTDNIEKALYSCDTSDDAPAVAYVSKMFAVPSELLPENRRKQLTAEEMRERGRRQRELRAQLEEKNLDAGVPLDKAAIEASVAEMMGETGDTLDTATSNDDTKSEHIIGFARLYSGKIRIGQKLYVLGPKYDPRFPDRHCSEITVQNLYLIMGRELEALPEVVAGNVFGIGGLEGHILKNGTLASTKENVVNMVGVGKEASPIVRVALEPVDARDMDKLVEGLQLLNQADPCVEVLLQETGEHVILTAGELHLERCLRDLKERFAKIDIHVSPPIVPFRESIVNSELPANRDTDNGAVPRGLFEIESSSKNITLNVRAVPLPSSVTEYLVQHTATIKSIVDQKAKKKSKHTEENEEGPEQIPTGMEAGDKIVSAEEFQTTLREKFAEAQKQGGPLASLWDGIVDQIWSFGPKRIGPNILVNRIPGYVRKPFFQVEESTAQQGVTEDHKDEVLEVAAEQQNDSTSLGILDVDFPIHTGFQLSTLTGPLCAEPVQGVCYIVQGVDFHREETEGADVRSRLALIQGKVISAMKEACRQGFLDWSPRLFLAMYECDIQASAEVLGRVYGVISKRKGKIISEDLKDGTPFWQIKALMPVIESFGFSDEIRKRTSGAASPQLVFSGFEMLDEDPFWVPTTEEELEDLGEKADKENLAKKYMDTVRKRKGMFVEKKLVEHAEKQRTLKK